MPDLPPVDRHDRGPGHADLRAVLLGICGWAGGLAALRLPGWTCLVLLVMAVLHLLHRRRRRRAVVTLLGCLLAAGAVAGVTALRVHAQHESAVAALAADRAAVTVIARVTSDPVLRKGRFGSYTITRVTVLEVLGRGRSHAARAAVLVLGGEEWTGVDLGSVVRARGRLAPADGPELAGVLSGGTAPRVEAQPNELFAGAAAVRAGIRASVAGAGGDAAAWCRRSSSATTSACPTGWWRTSARAG
jgi:competence protein ComEC